MLVVFLCQIKSRLLLLFFLFLLFSGCSSLPLSIQHPQKTPVPPGRVTEFALPTLNNSPFEITAGRDGNLWFTLPSRSSTFPVRIGRITPGGTVTEFALPTLDNSPFG